jgi:hypothetical protein
MSRGSRRASGRGAMNTVDGILVSYYDPGWVPAISVARWRYFHLTSVAGSLRFAAGPTSVGRAPSQSSGSSSSTASKLCCSSIRTWCSGPRTRAGLWRMTYRWSVGFVPSRPLPAAQRRDGFLAGYIVSPDTRGLVEVDWGRLRVRAHQASGARGHGARLCRDAPYTLFRMDAEQLLPMPYLRREAGSKDHRVGRRSYRATAKTSTSLGALAPSATASTWTLTFD